VHPYDRGILADLNIFLTIVRRQSMAQAAVELGVSASALSHRLRKLESDLGVRLINRTSRSIKPTEVGCALAAQLGAGFQTISDALTALERHRLLPVGRLRLNVLRDGARLLLGPVLRRYLADFPDIHLDVSVDDRFVDIVAEGFDAGIRYGDRVPRDMVGIALTRNLNWVVVASPDLIARTHRPKSPQDLMDLPCVQMRIGDNTSIPWELSNAGSMLRVDVRGPLCANETEHAVDAAIRGVGFAYCLERRVKEEIAASALEVVLPQYALEAAPFMIYYPSRRHPPPGLRQLIDIIREMEDLPRLIPASGARAAEEV
jgi:DNA-binding transcriptional LysR family regulator